MGDRKLPSTSDPAVTMMLAGKLKASEAENARLRAEAERLRNLERINGELRKQRDHETRIARAAIAERNAARAALNELHSEVVEIAENPFRGPDGQKAASDVLELIADALAREDGAS